MKFTKTILLTTLVSLLFFGGCSKDLEEYNKPAIYWYGKIVEYVSNGDLERADNYYSSLQGEHIGSPLLPEATMILAIAHMYYEEYLLSEHFLNEYIRRYATENEKEDAEFLKIKAKYMALPNPRRDQALIADAIKAAQEFKRNYPYSMYISVVDTMQTRLYMAEAALNETIADLYDRLDKPRSARYYRAIEPQPWIKWDEIDRANTPWYRAWFEGDGTQSWYAFMIPDTDSVVGRNSLPLDANMTDIAPQPQAQESDFETQNNQELAPLPKQTDPHANFRENELIKAKELLDNGIITKQEYKELVEKISKQ